MMFLKGSSMRMQFPPPMFFALENPNHFTSINNLSFKNFIPNFYELIFNHTKQLFFFKCHAQ